jgi:hypothetical protein
MALLEQYLRNWLLYHSHVFREKYDASNDRDPLNLNVTTAIWHTAHNCVLENVHLAHNCVEIETSI